MSTYLRKYGTTLDLSTAGSLRIRLQIRKAGLADFATGSDWTPATGDVKVSKDGGTLANIGTLPTYSNGRWEFTLSGTELSAKVIEVNVVDSATKAVDDEAFAVETFGNASAMYPGDYTILSLPNVAFGATGGLGPGIVRAGTAQAGATLSITLDAGASSTTDFYKGAFVLITGSTGAGQARQITAYNGTTKVATVATAWATNPTSSSTFALVATPNLDAIKAKTDTLNGTATYSGPVDPTSDGALRIVAGDGYESADRIPEWTFDQADWPDMTTGATGKFRVSTYRQYLLNGATAPAVLETDLDISSNGTTITIGAPLAEADTALLLTPPNSGPTPTHKFQLIVTTADSEDVTLKIGNLFTTRRIEPSA